MSLHPKFPAAPYAPLLPEHRWFPADEALRSTAYEKLQPPLVAKVRREIHDWRKSGYVIAVSPKNCNVTDVTAQVQPCREHFHSRLANSGRSAYTPSNVRRRGDFRLRVRCLN